MFTSGNAKKRWFKRHPFALIHPEGRPLYKGKSVVWCYASSDPAKEAWIVAIAGELKRRGGAMDRSVFAAAAAAAVAANGGEGGEMKINMKSEGGTDPAQRALVEHLAHRATVRRRRARRGRGTTRISSPPPRRALRRARRALRTRRAR